MATDKKFPTFQGHGLGALAQHPDPRDHLYSDFLKRHTDDIAKIAESLPEQAEVPKDQAVPIFNQGNLGSCTANEGVAHYMILQATEGKPVQALSRLQVYYNGRVALSPRYADRDSGSTGRAIAKVLSKQGGCLETTWPYRIGKFTKAPPDDCVKEALDHQLMQYLAIPYKTGTTLDLIRTSLAAGYPVGFSFDVYSNFNPDSDGLIPMPKGQVEGGHRMMLVGYRMVNGARQYHGRNSWGPRWGKGGRCWFTEDMVYQFFSDCWTYRAVE